MRTELWGIWGIVLGLILPGNSFSYGYPQDSVYPLGTVGCLFTNQLCGIEEVCIDDLLFGNCQRLDRSQDLHQYRLNEEALSALEEHILHLITSGYTWRDPYTQCVLQNALLASRRQVPFKRYVCKLASNEDRVSGEMGRYLEQIFQDYYDSYKPSAIPPEEKRDDDVIHVHKYFEKEPGEEKGFSDNYSYEDKVNLLEDLKFLGADNISLKDIQALQYYLESIRNSEDGGKGLYGDYYVPDVQRKEQGYDNNGGEWVEKEHLPQGASSQWTSASQDDQAVYPFDAEKEEILNKLKSGEISTSALSDEEITDLINYINERLPPDSKNKATNDLHLSNSDDDWSKSRPMGEGLIGSEDQMGNWAEDHEMDGGNEDINRKMDDTKEENGSLETDGTEEEDTKEKKNVETMMGLVTRMGATSTTSTTGTTSTTQNTKKPIQTDIYWIQMGGKLNGEQAETILKMINEALEEEQANIKIIKAERDEENGRLTLKINTTDPNVPFKTTIENIKDKVNKKLGLAIEDVGMGSHDNPVSLRVSDDRYIVLSFVLCGCIAGILLASVIIFLIRRNSKSKKKLAQLSGTTGEGNEPSQDYQDLCRQRMQGKSSEKPEPLHAASRIGSMSGEQVRSPSSRSSTSSWSEEPVTSNMDISTGHIVLSYMEDHLKNKDRLDREWEGLCSYEADPSSTDVANDPANIRKNRYSDTVPYDHSRVVLSTNSNASSSDYINASTITDHDPRNPAYIATQGPLPHTVADFWQMVWEQGSVVIVMLTRLTENGEAMCYRYWPEEGSDLYHIYEVHLVSEHIWCDDYLVRSFYLKNLQTNETRTVTQFHYLTWPDLGVPKSIKALLDFRRKVNKSYRGRSCPIVVHCSDGCGRTGTYTLIDMVLNRMAKGAKEIDIAATLEHIRDQRKNMVKTKEQFQFALAAVAEEVHAILKALPQ
ncbi:receptor-type tyrosine-protein phosphatase N2-like [Saccostrea cucullata]|uniref:receptor-type tyrosine-protein phosphatase N2-like n=1 Tax=Saccostrea cuccullata TaxID=36930 RepID=UPI002ED019CB